jgi:hypothetical protein
MQSKLTKPWGPYGVGTVVADNAAEAHASTGAIHVNPDRFAKLHEGGYFEVKEPERPIPSEVWTSAQEPTVIPEEEVKGTPVVRDEESEVFGAGEEDVEAEPTDLPPSESPDGEPAKEP